MHFLQLIPGVSQGVYPSRPSDVNADGRLAEAGYNPKDWVNVDKNGNPSAYGTNTFGANYTSMGSKNSLPIALSQNVKTLSMYLNSAGAQAGTALHNISSEISTKKLLKMV